MEGASKQQQQQQQNSLVPEETEMSPIHYYVCMPSGELQEIAEQEAKARSTGVACSDPIRSSSIQLLPDYFDTKLPAGAGDNSSVASDLKSKASHSSIDRLFIWELLKFARHRSWKKKVLTVLIFGTSLYVLYDLLFLDNIRNLITQALEWMTLNPFGAVFSFILFFAVATLLFVPPAILMFGAGYAFSNIAGFGYGFLTSTAVSFVGSCLGAILAFLRSRYMMRDLIELFAKRYPIVKALDRALERKGFRVMLLLRLCPIIPFNGLNYIGGVTSISLSDFTKALVGILPTILLWTFAGASTDRVTREHVNDDGIEHMYKIILLSSGVAFAIIAAVCIWRFATKELRREIEMDSAETWFRYKKKATTSTTSTNTAQLSSSDVTASQPLGASLTTTELEDLSSRTFGQEAGHEMTLQQHHSTSDPSSTRGILVMLGFDVANGLAGHFDGPEDGKDEEWFWLWT